MTTLVRRNQNYGWLPFLFNDFLKDELKVGVSSIMPAVNVKETENAFFVEVAATGVSKDDFIINIGDDNELVITMKKKNESTEEDKNVRYLRREFSYSKFQKSMVLPDNVNKEKIEAKVENGVLIINLPKLSENEIQKKQRMITVN